MTSLSLVRAPLYFDFWLGTINEKKKKNFCGAVNDSFTLNLSWAWIDKNWLGICLDSVSEN